MEFFIKKEVVKYFREYQITITYRVPNKTVFHLPEKQTRDFEALRAVGCEREMIWDG